MRDFSRLLLILLAVALSGPATARDELRIGIAQYPATMHPNIEAMLAKSYLLGFTQRPITTYDQSWELVCMLCVELPTIENGGAMIEPLPEGSEFAEGRRHARRDRGRAVHLGSRAPRGERRRLR
jgi:peptide/nickel transport system substrate-binding protein